jgi:hypothetical protein
MRYSRTRLLAKPEDLRVGSFRGNFSAETLSLSRFTTCCFLRRLSWPHHRFDSIIKDQVYHAIPTFDRSLAFFSDLSERAPEPRNGETPVRFFSRGLYSTTSYYGLYALVSTFPLSEYGEYYCVSRKSNLNAAFPLHRFFFDIDHILLTITPGSTVKHQYAIRQNCALP